MSPKTQTNIISLLVTAYCMASVIGSPQKITFFQEPDCIGNVNVTILETRDDLNSTWIGNPASILIIGLWKLAISRDLGDGKFEGFERVYYRTWPPRGICSNKTDWTNGTWKNSRITSADRLGSSDMTTSEVVFYSEVYSGLKYSVKQDMAKVAPRPMVMLSYIHLSNDTWNVYPEENFGGTPTVLNPRYDFASESVPWDNYAYNSSFGVVVGSVKKVAPDEDDDGGSSDASTIFTLPFTLIVTLAVSFNLISN